MAQPEDLHGVADLGEPCLPCDRSRPGLDFGSLDFDRGPTRPAHQMVMVMAGTAQAVPGLPVRSHQNIHVVGLSQAPEGTVDRRQSDPISRGMK